MSGRWAQITCAGCGAKNRVNLDRASGAVCGRCQAKLMEVEEGGSAAKASVGKSRASRPTSEKVSGTGPKWLPQRLRSIKWQPVHLAYAGAGLLLLYPVARAVVKIPVVSHYWNEVLKPNAKELYWRVKEPAPRMVLTGDRINGRLTERPLFTEDSPWNQRVDTLPVDELSQAIIDRTGPQTRLKADFGASYRGRPHGIPYIVVSGDTPKVPVKYVAYPHESDPGPFPIPHDAPIEGGNRGDDGDRHLLVVDRDNWKLYELFRAFPNGTDYRADSGAIWDLKVNAKRPEGWTSADAAGLPILPGLVRYDEVVEKGEIRHALRFTVERTRAAHIPPATHHASTRHQMDFPPMGTRVRLRADYDTSGFPPHARVILKAMKEYGMILADNGGNWFISGTADPRWDDNQLRSLGRLAGRDLEVVQMAKPEPVRKPAVAPDGRLRIELPAEKLPTDLPRTPTELPPPLPR